MNSQQDEPQNVGRKETQEAQNQTGFGSFAPFCGKARVCFSADPAVWMALF